MHLFMQEPSTSTPPTTSKVSTYPPDAVSVEHSADNRAPLLDVPMSPPTEGLDDMLPTGPPMTFGLTSDWN